MTKFDPFYPFAATNQRLRTASGILAIMCALALMIGTCTFFTRGVLANVLMLALTFGGGVSGWYGHRQEPQNRKSIFFGKVKLTTLIPMKMVEPGYPAISVATLLLALCIML